MKGGRKLAADEYLVAADTDQAANLWPDLQGWNRFVSHVVCCLEE